MWREVECTNEEWLGGLDFGRLGVEEGGEGLEFRKNIVVLIDHFALFQRPH